MLSDERIAEIMGWNFDGPGANYEDRLRKLRAVAEAAVKDASQSCTCPSGDGSLRFPCPSHPQASAAVPMYECIACGHLYHEKVSQCDCLENPNNQYHNWVAFPLAASPPRFDFHAAFNGDAKALEHCSKHIASAAVPDGWREVMQGLVECARDEIVRCEGMKCREPNCISCNDELEATTSVERSREFVFRARAMLAASQPEVKSL